MTKKKVTKKVDSKEQPKNDKGEAVVVNEKGNVVRVYSKKRHGAKYAELAEQYVSNPKRSGYTVS